jgi:hypothetical protein
MPEFIKGLELSRLFFEEAVRPVLEESFPGLRYAAARLWTGSEVLGFDTEMSSDHEWGPRVDLFVGEAEHGAVREQVSETLRQRLPRRFRGYPTNFVSTDPSDPVQRLAESDEGPVNHKVSVLTPRGFFLDYLAFDIEREIEPADWLTFPEQKLRTVSSGGVFHDEIGLEELRRRFAYYPRDVWLYQLGSAWGRVGQEEHFMGRAGMVGDEIGSALIGARLVRDLMRLCFLMERTYAPYSKWFGTAFKQLSCAGALSPHLSAALTALTWQERERHLAAAYRLVAEMHNELGVTGPLPTEPRDFFGRPFLVIALHGFAGALFSQIVDERIRRLARPPIGGVDIFSDSTDLLQHASWRATLRKLYE